MLNNNLILRFENLFSKGRLFVVSGPSGCGKSTIIREVLKADASIRRSVSVTTRAPRKGEKHDADYAFVSEAQFLDMLKKQEFLEHAQVYEHYYGTPKKFINDVLKEGRTVLLDIDIQGAKQVRDLGYPAGYIYLLPPDRDVHQKRLAGRRTDNEEEMKRRLNKFEEEIAQIKFYDYVVFNKTIEDTVHQVCAIIEAEKHKIIK